MKTGPNKQVYKVQEKIHVIFLIFMINVFFYAESVTDCKLPHVLIYQQPDAFTAELQLIRKTTGVSSVNLHSGPVQDQLFRFGFMVSGKRFQYNIIYGVGSER